MQPKLKSVALLSIGWGFILLGIAGLFLPVLQGILFLLIGLFVLSAEYVWAHKLLQKLRERFPAVAKQFDAASIRASQWFGRLRRHQQPIVPVDRDV